MAPQFNTSRRRLLTPAAPLACIVSFAACVGPPPPTTAVADWCWRHHLLAPPGALIVDDGPSDSAHAVVWDHWLGQVDDVPIERRDAHRTQRELIDALIETGRWTDESRERYRRAAQSDPTPSTVCETVGARILVDDNGSLPLGWHHRFLDADNPAFSNAALEEATAADAFNEPRIDRSAPHDDEATDGTSPETSADEIPSDIPAAVHAEVHAELHANGTPTGSDLDADGPPNATHITAQTPSESAIDGVGQ